MLTHTKSPFASRGVWGGIIALLAAVAAFFGYAVDEADARALTELAVAIFAGVGGALSIIGRIRAQKKIG